VVDAVDESEEAARRWIEGKEVRRCGGKIGRAIEDGPSSRDASDCARETEEGGAPCVCEGTPFFVKGSSLPIAARGLTICLAMSMLGVSGLVVAEYTREDEEDDDAEVLGVDTLI
jgi:hypothetical protein